MGFAAGFNSGWNAVRAGLQEHRQKNMSDEFRVLAERGVQGLPEDASDIDRQKALLKEQARIFMANGEPERAVALQTKAHELDRSALQMKQIQQGLEQGEYQTGALKRAEERALRDEEKRKKREALVPKLSFFRRSNEAMAQYEQASADYQDKLAAGANPAQLGPPPQKPQAPSLTIGDTLHDAALMLSLEAESGDYDPEKWNNLAGRMAKLEEEGYSKALMLAQSGADIKRVVETFNSSGKLQVTPDAVVSDRMVTNKDGTPTRELVFKGANGKNIVINTQSELQALGKAEEALANFWKGKEADVKTRVADANIEQSKAAAAASYSSARENDAEAKQKKDAQEAAVNLAREANPKLTKTQEQAIRAGVIGALAKDKDKSEWTFNLGDFAGMRGNKETGAMQMLDLRTGKVIADMPAPGAASSKAGPKVGEERIINGQKAQWDGRGWKAIK